MGSDEYYAKHGSNPTGYVRGLYNDLLHRDAEPAGLETGRALKRRQPHRCFWACSIARSLRPVRRSGLSRYPGPGPGFRRPGHLTSAVQRGLPIEQLRLLLAGSAEYSDLQDGAVANPVIGLDTTSAPQPFVQNPITSIPTDITVSNPFLNATAPKIAVDATIDINRQPGNQSEVAIGINPANPKQMFAFANENDLAGNGMSASFSTDSGVTWTSRVLGDGSDGLPTAFSDPWIAWDVYGNLSLPTLVSTVTRTSS